MTATGLVGRLKQIPGLTRLGLLLRRVLLRIEGTGPRLAQVEQAVADIHPATVDNSVRLNRLEKHMPAVLNAITSFSGAARRLERHMAEAQQQVREVWAGEAERSEALGRTWHTQTEHAKSINDLWQRMETIRHELMVELRYGDSRGAAPAVEAKIIDAAKVDSARAEGLRVNLGCGHLPLDGYVNADMRDLPGVDVIATATELPFGEGELVELFSAHLVEHFPQEQLQREILPYWISLLGPDGVLRMVVPDAASMLAAFSEGDIPWEQLRRVLYGDQEYEGDFHFNMYSSETLAGLLAEAGLTDVEVEAEGRENGDALEMQLVARRAK
ncbi:MAG: hypothetical protein GY812_10490 [Actinomycetia bacterium]|nr:hypothetical protein [Actinomycetes bacterium]